MKGCIITPVKNFVSIISDVIETACPMLCLMKKACLKFRMPKNNQGFEWYAFLSCFLNKNR